MTAHTSEFDGEKIRYDYHLCAERPISGSDITYHHIDTKIWFDLHSALEFGIVLQGRVRRHWGENHRDLTPGDAWFCGVFEQHGYQVVAEPCEVAVMEIWPDFLGGLLFPENPQINWLEMFTLPQERRPLVTDAQRAALLDIGARIRANNPNDESPSIHMRLLLVEALLLFADPRTPQGPLAIRPKDAYAKIAPAIDLALRSRKLVNIEEASAACGLKRDQFLRAFHRVLGISFGQFALRHRLHGATADLTYTATPVKAIAKDWGFTDESHLHRLFVQHYGCTPSVHRRRIQQRRERGK
jgi:AraC-like DNA-binding protein